MSDQNAPQQPQKPATPQKPNFPPPEMHKEAAANVARLAALRARDAKPPSPGKKQ